MAAVVDGAARLGLVVYGTEKLPLRGAHLGTGRSAAGRGVKKKADDEAVALRYEEAAQLIEPQRAVDARRRRS